MQAVKAIFLSVAVSFGIIYFMSALVNMRKDDLSGKSENTNIEFLRVRKDSETSERKRQLPKKPENTKTPPKSPNIDTSNQDDDMNSDMALASPDFSNKLSGDGLFSPGSGGSQSLMPIVRIMPQMPRKAAMRGIEGYVIVRFTVSKTGATKDISIVEAVPAKIFNKAARRAISKWRYRPQVIDGKAIETKQSVRLDFKLED